MNGLRKAFLGAAIYWLGTAAHADLGELHTFHCLYGCPVGAPATNDVVVREIYTLSSDDLTKFADWVAYRISPDTLAKSKGVRNWQRDPWLGLDETLAPVDYDDASETLRVDRGHQAPLAAFSGAASWSDTNILSNITPQSKALNEGSWQRLEARETDLVRRSGKPVFVTTGPLFERLMRGLPKVEALHRVPSGYWKIVAQEGRITAFVFDQSAARNADLCAMRAPLSEVVLRARLRFFPDIDVSKLGSLDADLGCATLPPGRPAPEEIPVEPSNRPPG